MYNAIECLKIKMHKINSIRIVTTKVPAIELDYADTLTKTMKTVIFSMLSDHNVQQTLLAIKRLKKEGELAI